MLSFPGKTLLLFPCDPFKKKINVTGISNFNNNTNLFLVPMLGRTWSFFQSQRNINTVVLDTWSWCKMMWSYLPTNTQHFMERMEMKCLGCLNLDDFIHLILYCGTILQCDTNTEFCDLCGYSFNKTQNFSAGRALFWTFLVFHLPTLKHKCLKFGLSMLVHLTNSNSSLFFILFIQIHPERGRRIALRDFFPTIRIVSELFSMWGDYSAFPLYSGIYWEFIFLLYL